MPTILRFRGFNIMIWTGDHGPAHVHAVGHGHDPAFFLGCESGGVRLRGKSRLPASEIAALTGFISENRDILCKAWKELHDDK
jgi:hypothetical protein